VKASLISSLCCFSAFDSSLFSTGGPSLASSFTGLRCPVKASLMSYFFSPLVGAFQGFSSTTVSANITAVSNKTNKTLAQTA
jgi:hypothetical protein